MADFDALKRTSCIFSQPRRAHLTGKADAFAQTHSKFKGFAEGKRQRLEYCLLSMQPGDGETCRIFPDMYDVSAHRNPTRRDACFENDCRCCAAAETEG